MVRLGDGALLTVVADEARVSMNDGKTWTRIGTIASGPAAAGPGTVAEGVLLRTRGGAVVLVYLDMAHMRWKWDDKTHQPLKDNRLDVWAVRSLDGGKTWIDRQRILKGYCGALIDIIETSKGNVVVPVQRLLYNPGRHETAAFVSADQGKSWRESNLVDIGGHGNHDGAFEATLTELTDGRLWMLLRTNRDRFWQAFSADGGLTWGSIGPSDIEASSSPGQLKRLADGRLVLVWNRLYPEGKKTVHRVGGKISAVPASWQREELSLAFSEDDGRTWTRPVVIARKPGAWLSYPYVFESRPGELWIYASQAATWMQLKEKDFAGADHERQMDREKSKRAN